MRRIKFLLPLSIAVIMLSCNKETTPEHYNFVFIVVDDLGYSDLGYSGSSYYESPNIDALASKGTEFTSGYANCAVCSPSRASLMTGNYPTDHGITDYIGARTGEAWRSMNRHTKLLPPEYNHALPSEYTTLPEALKAAGYKTFFAGKWHLGGADNNSLPTDHGFDENQGGHHQGGPYTGGYFSPFNNPYLTDYPEEVGMAFPTKLANETNRFIKENKDEKFLAYLSFYAVHGPIQTTEEKWSKYRDKAENLGIEEEGFEMERILPIRKNQDNPVYAGLIEHVDEAVGSVVENLKSLGLAKNTVIIFTSDNGGVASGDNYSTNSLALRGGKGYQWEGGLRVPYIVYFPNEGSNEKVDTPVTGMDLYPTILDIAGVAFDRNTIDGISLKPLLKGNQIENRPLYWHYPHYGNQGGEPHSIIREGAWKLIHYWEDGRKELYNLKNDQGEQNNLAMSSAEKTENMSKKLMDWLRSEGAKTPVHDSLYDPIASQKVLDRYKNNVWPRLEKQRKAMLQPDWKPNADWWGSSVQKDSIK